MRTNPLLEQIKKFRAKYIDIYVDNSFDLSHRIHYLMGEKGWDQKELAKALGKSESEISKWLSGSHNFTLKTLAKIEDALEGKLLQVCDESFDFDHKGVIFMYTEPYDIGRCVLESGVTEYNLSKTTQIKAVAL